MTSREFTNSNPNPIQDSLFQALTISGCDAPVSAHLKRARLSTALICRAPLIRVLSGGEPAAGPPFTVQPAPLFTEMGARQTRPPLLAGPAGPLDPPTRAGGLSRVTVGRPGPCVWRPRPVWTGVMGWCVCVRVRVLSGTVTQNKTVCVCVHCIRYSDAEQDRVRPCVHCFRYVDAE